MRLLCFCLFLHTAFYSDATFGTPYLKNSQLCHPWSCVTTKLNLSNTLPSKASYGAILRSLLPSGPWQERVDAVLDTCYRNRRRNYMSTCPSQALLHCTVDALMESCPEGYNNIDDGCNPVSSLAGTKYMFTQSRYKELQKNLPIIKSPAWFMKNYFDSKCCNLPEIINSTVLKDCGFESFIHYYEHTPRTDLNRHPFMTQATTTKNPTTPTQRVVDFNSIVIPERQFSDKGELQKNAPAYLDPLHCCDMSDFILPSMREACAFKPSWNSQTRFVVNPDTHFDVSTTVRPEFVRTITNKDVRVVPLSCEKETCIFRNLKVVSESGEVDKMAFTKLLDNFTSTHPTWDKAKARVITQCINKPNNGYEGACKINQLLGCTLDVLSENCPYASKNDVCKRSRRNNTVCQISSSMYRPKYRRGVCGLPNLVSAEALTSCGLKSLSRTEYVPDPPAPKPVNWRSSLYSCKDNNLVTSCLMGQMNILNKYGFMDYFRMKDRIRSFASRHQEWAPLTDFYFNTLVEAPKYKDYCTSPRKVLNVLDAMLSTCPVSKRKDSPGCRALFQEITFAVSHHSKNMTKNKADEITKHFNHMFLQRSTPKIKKHPLFDFGLLQSSGVPAVSTVDVDAERKLAKVILPVYMRMKEDSLQVNTSSLASFKNGVFQSTPFLLHNKI